MEAGQRHLYWTNQMSAVAMQGPAQGDIHTYVQSIAQQPPVVGRHPAVACSLTLCPGLPLQSSLNKNGLTTTGVYVDSSEAAVKQAGNTCQNGAINGLCIGELDDHVFDRQLPGML